MNIVLCVFKMCKLLVCRLCKKKMYFKIYLCCVIVYVVSCILKWVFYNYMFELSVLHLFLHIKSIPNILKVCIFFLKNHSFGHMLKWGIDYMNIMSFVNTKQFVFLKTVCELSLYLPSILLLFIGWELIVRLLPLLWYLFFYVVY